MSTSARSACGTSPPGSPTRPWRFAKGFAVWDLSPGHYILHAAGGVTIDLDGNPIALDYGLNTLPEINKTMGQRRKFIAAGNQVLAEEIRDAIRL